MHPKPSAETARPWVPSERFFIVDAPSLMSSGVMGLASDERTMARTVPDYPKLVNVEFGRAPSTI
jgi:hypothetical protein